MTLSPNTRLGRYEIRSQLGKGGMGEVYLAKDTQLARTVALKILPAEIAGDLQRMRRFNQEARAASALNHPNVAHIYEIGEADGMNFIAMEFIDGETLRQRMTSTQMKLGEVLDVATQIAGALAAAHAAGIIHRDIKPENVIVRGDGYVKVVDFGLAKLAERQPDAIDSKASTEMLVRTEPGVVLGTVAYMSPEQARGLDADLRTDIWSLGVVLYEMVAGHLPFEGETSIDIINSILEREPPPLARYSREAPEALEWIVYKALCKEKGERYQTAREMLTDLRRLKQRLEFEGELKRSGQAGRKGETPAAGVRPAAVETRPAPADQPASSADYPVTAIKRRRATLLLSLLSLLTVAAIITYFYVRQGSKTSIDSLAVLPFINTNIDPETEYLSDGISDSIINNLSQLPNLKVISFSSVLRYKGQKVDPQAVGHELNVRAVLMGRLTQRGDDLSISTELVDVQDNHRIWGTQYNRKLSDLLALQTEISRDISGKLRLRLSSEEQKLLSKGHTENTEAYQLYLRGRFYWSKYTEDGFKKAIECFNQAVEKDPSYARAYAGVADSYIQLGINFLPPKENYPKAEAYALRALKLDGDLAEAHVSLGAYNLLYEWNWPKAEEELRRAIELNPNYPEAHHFYGHYLETIGRMNEAIAEFKRGLEIDPLSLIINNELAWAYYHARRYDKEAIAELNKALAVSGNWSAVVAELAYVYAVSGRRDEAQKIIQELKERAAKEFIDPYLIALIYSGLGEKGQAFEWLGKAYEERSSYLTWIKVEPKFDPLRPDPRFVELLRLIGHP